jgi:hypothetical protein
MRRRKSMPNSESWMFSGVENCCRIELAERDELA